MGTLAVRTERPCVEELNSDASRSPDRWRNICGVDVSPRSQDAIPLWVTYVERFGISTFLVIFMCGAMWRLLPHLLNWLKATAETSRVITAAIPKIATAIEHNTERLGKIEEQLKKKQRNDLLPGS